jgi:S1-C subfamily serine protease
MKLFRTFVVVLAVMLPRVGLADFLKGLEGYESGDFATALKEWRPLANRGDVQAQINLADIYYHGRGVPPDSKEAVKWLKSAAVQGDSIAAYQLGVIYKLGYGLPAVPRDRDEAALWYQIAVNRGNREALYDLGEMHYREGNYKEAAMLLPLSSNSGNARAAFIMGELYEKGLGVPHDNSKAAKWHRLASDGGLSDTQMHQIRNGAKVAQTMSNLPPPPNWTEGKTASSQTLTVKKPTVERKPETPNEQSVVQYVPSAPSKPFLSTHSVSSGSGFLISKMGHVITNAHVIKGCKRVLVIDNANKQTEIDIYSIDRKNDLALLKLPLIKMAFSETRALISKLGTKLVPLVADGLLRSEEIELGEMVMFAGFQNKENAIAVSGGVVSDINETENTKGRFQLDADVPPGISGGPIYDSYGNIVGIVASQTNKLDAANSIGSPAESVSFGTKASTVMKFLAASGLQSKWSKRSRVMTDKEFANIVEKQVLMVKCVQ